MPAFESPYTKRLRRDFEEMKALREDSTILDFKAQGDPPDKYILTFKGGGLRETAGGKVQVADRHEVEVSLGMNYPRQMPEIHWKTSILHPNISGGRPCFGNFVMTPNVRLTQIAEMLWDMNRMAIYNPYEGYGGDKADRWRELRQRFSFPVDNRILRDLAPPPPSPEEPEEPEMVIMGAGYRKEWRPGGRPESPEELKAAVEDWLRANDLMYDARVYTPREWEDRGERYGQRSLLTIATEGPLYDLVNEGTGRKLHQQWEQFLASLGLWYELGYAWSIHLYPVEPTMGDHGLGIAMPRRKTYSVCRFMNMDPGSPDHLSSIIAVQDDVTKHIVQVGVTVIGGVLQDLTVDCVGKGPSDFEGVMAWLGSFVERRPEYRLVCRESRPFAEVVRLIGAAIAEEGLAEKPRRRDVEQATTGAEERMRNCFGIRS